MNYRRSINTLSICYSPATRPEHLTYQHEDPHEHTGARLSFFSKSSKKLLCSACTDMERFLFYRIASSVKWITSERHLQFINTPSTRLTGQYPAPLRLSVSARLLWWSTAPGTEQSPSFFASSLQRCLDKGSTAVSSQRCNETKTLQSGYLLHIAKVYTKYSSGYFTEHKSSLCCTRANL